VNNSLTFGIGHTALGAQSGWMPVGLVPLAADALVIGANAGDPSQAMTVASFGFAYGGSVGGDEIWNRIRGANVFKSISATASGSTDVWLVGGLVQIRVLGFTVSVAGTLAATDVLTIQLQDGGTTFWRGLATVSGTDPVGDTQMGADYGLTGYKTSAAGNDITVNLSAAMATGAVAVNMWGTQDDT
jgi:hypothetical protein